MRGAGWRRLRAWGRRSPRVREASGDRPGQLRGPAFSGWTRTGTKAGESPPDRGVKALVLSRKNDPVAQNRRGGAPEGDARCGSSHCASTISAPFGAPSPRSSRGDDRNGEAAYACARSDGAGARQRSFNLSLPRSLRMTARFRPEGPYGFTGDEIPRRRGEARGAYRKRAHDYCEIVVSRAEMDFARAYRTCPDGACRRARRCLGPDYSCRPAQPPPPPW